MKTSLFFKLSCKALLLFTGCIYTMHLHAQTITTDSTNYTAAIHNAIAAYHQYLSPQNSLYNGAEYVDYPFLINDGNPYFETYQFTNGSVEYDGMLHENVPLLYDELREQLVIKDFDGLNKINLNAAKVSSFSLLNHLFVKLGQDSLEKTLIRPGFYEVLYQGNISIYKKQTKKLLESVTISEGIRRKVDEQDNYFLKKGDDFFPVNNKKEIFSVAKDKKKEVQRFIKKNKLNIRKEKDVALPRIAAYYDQLTNR